MRAYIDHTFAKGFFLSEEHLIKLDDIIKKRLGEHGANGPLEYKVYRADGLVYSTDNHKTVIEEENSSRNAITRLNILYSDDSNKLDLDFDRGAGTKLKIETADKDFAYLLFADIKDYLGPEVLKFRSFKFKDTRIDRFIFPISMLFVMATMLRTLATPKLNDAKFNILLAKGSIEAKVNYLLENGRIRADLSKIWYSGLVVIGLAFVSELALSSMDRFFPVNIFCTGKEIARYQRLVDLRGKIIWGVLISLGVSLVAGLILAYMPHN